MLAEELFARALRSLKTCVLVKKIYEENHFYHQNDQQNLMQVLIY